MRTIFAIALVLATVSARSSTIIASTASLSDVSNAVAAATHGDVVQVPSGSATWSGQLVVTKAIGIIGAGTNSTIISNTTGAIRFVPSTNLPIRLSSIRFNAASSVPTVEILGKTGSGARETVSSFRVDRCFFRQGKRAINPSGWAYGVIDHNTFLNCDICVGMEGDDSASWIRGAEWGTTNTVVIESNSMLLQADAAAEPNEPIYHQGGARSVTRFNTIDGSSASAYNLFALDSHGNWNSGAVVDPASTNALQTRGQPAIEFYGNTVSAYSTYQFVYIRGGASLLFSNTFTTVTGTPTAIYLTEEEGWQTSMFSPLRTNWPAADGITNTFFWSNTLNGSAISSVKTNRTEDATLIRQNRDYWMQAPNSTNGSPAGILAAYTPLVFPHPRVTAEDSVAPVSITIGTATVGTLRQQ